MSADLSTTYLGLRLKNPLVISACPLTAQIEQLRRLEEAGAAAAVLPSLFEEQIEYDADEIARVYDFHTDSFAESLTYFPDEQDYITGPEEYLQNITRAKKAVNIPIIASLNGTNKGGWIRYAKMMQDAGADALELNVYFVAADAELTGRDVESRYLDLVAAVKQSISIPLAVKVGPYFSAMANMGMRLAQGGADGLVLFNRFFQPDIDLDTLEMRLATPPQFALRVVDAATVDRHPARSHRRLAGRHRRNPQRPRFVEGPLGRGRRWHGRVGAIPQRYRRGRQNSRRTARMDGRERIHFGRATQGKHELRELPRSLGLPARQLHEDADVVRR